MDYEKERKILTDVDGVLLDWESAFTAWMGERGYTPVNPEVYKQSVRYNIEQEFALAAIKSKDVDWMIVDHYAIDECWHKKNSTIC